MSDASHATRPSPALGETVTVDLTEMAAGGRALGRLDGRVIFVSGGIAGEQVSLHITADRKGYLEGALTEVVRASPDRVPARFPRLDESGGVEWQHLAYPAQLRWKEHIVRQQLTRFGGIAAPEVRPAIGMPEGADPWRYRAVAQFAVGSDGAIGFRRAQSHEVIAMADCPLCVPALDSLYQQVRDWLRGTAAMAAVARLSLRVAWGGAPDSPEAPDLAHWHDGGFPKGFLTLEASPASTLTPADARRLLDDALAAVPRLAGAISQGPGDLRVRAGAPSLWERVLDTTYRVAPESFFQVNARLTSRLVTDVLDAAEIRTGDVVLDGYCGVGLFSVPLARSAGHVWGIEVAPTAVADAVTNARLNGVSDCTFAEGKIERVLRDLKLRRADVVVVDPPRAGCARQALDAMLSLAPRVFIYVSCDPATLARDARIITGADYVLRYAQPIDMFPISAHIETVAVFDRLLRAKGS
jgi:23S rRNA (uracil1939-C5)-methyltransferase